MAIRQEPQDLASKRTAEGATGATKRPFNASLALSDGISPPRPYLAEALPELHSADWQVFSDGRMETSYRLRAGLTWHDGTPLTAEDFVFAWRVYTLGESSVFHPVPQGRMEQVSAPDPRTLLIRWHTLYPGADAFLEAGFDPLPRHVLEESFAAAEREPSMMPSFLSRAFWTTEYIGAGPYVLKRWEPGSFIESEAFTGHVLGEPKIARLVMRLIADENAALTNMLAGEVGLATRLTLRFEHGQILKREWAASGRGEVLFTLGTSGQYLAFQQRPELLKWSELRDIRVRKALISALDRQAVNDALFGGESVVLDTFLNPREPYYPEVDRALTKYPYGPRRAEQLIAEAGLVRDEDGFYVGAPGVQFRPELQMTAGTLNERAGAVITDGWHSAGINNTLTILPSAQARSAETRARFPGITSLGGVMNAFEDFTSEQIGSPANRWIGQNRGGWSNGAYDRLWEAFNATLERREREQLIVQLAQLLSDEVPGYPLYANVDVWAYDRSLRGFVPGVTQFTYLWNVHDWVLQ
jgi:peptide/nickel transport system substrate-binding protein